MGFRIATALMLLGAPLVAQNAGTSQAAPRPADWHVRFDRPGVADSSMKIDQMGPGWHFTTNGRGSGIAWRDATTASGNFKAEVDATLFPVAGNHLEGFGMIIGGTNLTADNQTYYYFLIRKDGQWTLKHRAGAAVHEVVPWTANPAIVQQTGDSQAHNVLTVEATRDSVRFLVNGQRVHGVARQGYDVNGIVGLRVNHGLSVHVARAAVAPM